MVHNRPFEFRDMIAPSNTVFISLEYQQHIFSDENIIFAFEISGVLTSANWTLKI
jgi:hypothetical protein